MSKAAQRVMANGFVADPDAIEMCEILNPEKDNDGASFRFRVRELGNELQFVDLPGGWAEVRRSTQVPLVYLPPPAADRLRTCLQYQAAIGGGADALVVAALGFNPREFGLAAFLSFASAVGNKRIGMGVLQEWEEHCDMVFGPQSQEPTNDGGGK
ncbi:MAG: hypothetical protein PWQ61_3517 [Betaproteobacteria bacterium]|nr:hypothetical protein [Betaproteobacteria bacterium]